MIGLRNPKSPFCHSCHSRWFLKGPKVHMPRDDGEWESRGDLQFSLDASPESSHSSPGYGAEKRL